MDDKQLINDYQDQMLRSWSEDNQVGSEPVLASPEITAQNNPTLVNPNAPVQTLVEPSPEVDTNKLNSFLAPIKKVITNPKNRLFVILGSIVFTLILLALISPLFIALIRRKPSEQAPTPTPIPEIVAEEIKTFTFNPTLSDQFFKLEKDTRNSQLIDLELSFPQTEWEVEY